MFGSINFSISQRLFMVTVCALCAASARAGGIPYQACGELVQTSGFPSCLIHVADDGTFVRVSDPGDFRPGDRVTVDGFVNLNTASNCAGSLVANIQVTSIERCFAECGTLVEQNGCLRFESDRGGVFALDDAEGFGDGERVYVSATGVSGIVDCAGESIPLIGGNQIASCFEAFGRIVPEFGCDSLLTANGDRYDLEITGDFDRGDFVFVQGYIDPVFTGVCGQPWVRSNAIMAAFGGAGTLIRNANCELSFQSDANGFGQLYALENTDGFVAGDRVFVTGRIDNNCSPHPTCPIISCLRDNTIDPLVSGCGTLEFGPTNCAVVNFGPGEPSYQIEYFGNLSFGSEIFVAGGLVASDPTCTGSASVIRHNLALPCVDTCGTLEPGFECTPLFFTDEGEILWLEDTGGFTEGDRIRVVGGRDGPCTSFCPFTCLRVNDVLRCEIVPGDISGDGAVDIDDIDGFVRVLLGLESDALLIELADVNFDTKADGGDVQLFTSIILGDA